MLIHWANMPLRSEPSQLQTHEGSSVQREHEWQLQLLKFLQLRSSLTNFAINHQRHRDCLGGTRLCERKKPHTAKPLVFLHRLTLGWAIALPSSLKQRPIQICLFRATESTTRHQDGMPSRGKQAPPDCFNPNEAGSTCTCQHLQQALRDRCPEAPKRRRQLSLCKASDGGMLGAKKIFKPLPRHAMPL